ncbi:MAG TPA: DUF1003 domain-containing protein [Kofleriaceae bacterium]|jgi:uncharacterized membrane protein
MSSPAIRRAAASRRLRTLRGRADLRRTLGERMADWMTAAFGSTLFLLFNAIWFVVWIAWNAWPGIVPFDRFPFGMLTMVVSLEAIFLSIFVLIAQNRSARIDELRAEVDLQVNTIAEAELTKLLQVVVKLAHKQGVDLSTDAELQAMIAPTNIAAIEQELEAQITPAGHDKPAPRDAVRH